MKKFLLFYILFFFSLISCKNLTPDPGNWSLVLHRPGQKEMEVVKITDISKHFIYNGVVNNLKINFSFEPKLQYSVFRATASSDNPVDSVYFSLKCNYGKKNRPYNFNGEVKSAEIYRQSPHDVNAWITEGIAKQAIPMIAYKTDSCFYVALNGAPMLYNNFTSQAFYPSQNTIFLSSGDNGETPGLIPEMTNQLSDYNTDKSQIMSPGKIQEYFHSVSKNNPHVFEGIIFKSNATGLNSLRKDVNELVSLHYSNGKYTSYFGALSFTTSYMNLRVNDSGRSKYWVVPSVEYANIQYGRDAFWISTMLDPYFSSECLKSELAEFNMFAEYPLLTVIWAYRDMKQGKVVDLVLLQKYVDAIEKRIKNNLFYSYTEKDGRLDFQYWGDVIAFDKNDVITYNQGLLALALVASKEMGLQTKTDPKKVLREYRNMFNDELGYYPISKLKNKIMGPDPLVPDLISQIYFNKQLLDSSTVKRHYDRMCKYSKTDYGFKSVSLPDGNYLPKEMYDVEGYISQINREDTPDGRYLKGGSWFLYDNLFLIDAYLHGITEAEDILIWRVCLDFKIGATTYECLNTKTGEAWKPNMGWNVAIYSFWQKLVDEGKASNRLFEEIDKIVENE